MKDALLTALPTVPGYTLCYLPFYFLLPRRSRFLNVLFLLYSATMMGTKAVFDFYLQIDPSRQFSFGVVSMAMVLTLPVMLLLCFSGSWQRRLLLAFPVTYLQSLCILPVYLWIFKRFRSFSPPVWLLNCALFSAVSLLAVLVVVLLLRPMLRALESLSRPVYTTVAVAFLLLHITGNLVQFLVLIGTASRIDTVFRYLPGLLALTAVLVLFLLVVVYRYNRQTVAIAAARQRLRQQSLYTRQRSVEELRALHQAHRQCLEKICTLLEKDDPSGALEALHRMTRQEARSVQRYADNPVADVVLADTAQRCREAGVTLQVRGTLPRDCPLPPADLASLLYNLFSNAVTAAARAPRPATVEIDFATAAGCLVITVRNSTAAAPARPRGAGHGFGRKILQEITARYDGSYTLVYNGGQAEATALVRLPERQGGTHV